MTALFYASASVSVIAALMVVTQPRATHALIYLVLLFGSIASVFFTLGAPFVAVLQIVIYAGAIMVLFVFAVMMLNLGPDSIRRELGWMNGSVWVLPVFLALALAAVMVAALAGGTGAAGAAVGPKQVGISLYTTYLIGLELASLLLLAGLVAAFHFGVVPSRVVLDERQEGDSE